MASSPAESIQTVEGLALSDKPLVVILRNFFNAWHRFTGCDDFGEILAQRRPRLQFNAHLSRSGLGKSSDHSTNFFEGQFLLYEDTQSGDRQARQ